MKWTTFASQPLKLKAKLTERYNLWITFFNTVSLLPCSHIFVTIESAHPYAFELLTATPIDLDP